MSNNTLKQVLTAQALRENAGSISYFRGRNYFDDGSVGKLTCNDNAVSATVSGTQPYTVKLFCKNNSLQGSCSCPLGKGGEFCKHQVALGLAFLNQGMAKAQKQAKSSFNWEKFIQGCSREDVENILFEMSPHCPKIIEKYRMQNLPGNPASLTKELKKKIDALVATAEMCGDEFAGYDYDTDEWDDTDYQEEFSEGHNQLAKALAAVADKKHYDVILEVAQYGIECMRNISVPEEELIADFVESMLLAYVQAALLGATTPKDLIAQIEAWEKDTTLSNFDAFDSIYTDMPAPVKDLWYEHDRALWGKLPALKMGGPNPDAARQRLEARLLEGADERGDTNFVLAILKRNLSRPHDVMALVAEYRRQNLLKEILPLLKEARYHFPNQHDIRDALTDELQKLGRHDDALALAWAEFQANPLTPEPFSFLQKTAKRANCEADYFARTLALLAEFEAQKAQTPSYYGYAGHARARRVEILLDAGQNDEAWELGKNLTSDDSLTLRLIAARAKEHPIDAADACRKLVEQALVPTGEHAYVNAVELLLLYKKYTRAAGQETQFKTFCQQIKTNLWRRRNLLDLLARHHL
ncbi:MAG: hypothetical protein PHT80_12300 [Lentisphaeria bacterium]|nr:hypothetical protein [Lentisphaeria bacterium]